MTVTVDGVEYTLQQTFKEWREFQKAITAAQARLEEAEGAGATAAVSDEIMDMSAEYLTAHLSSHDADELDPAVALELIGKLGSPTTDGPFPTPTS